MDHAYLVVDGLRAGERVIVQGQQSVQPGMQVKAEPWTPPPVDGGPTDAAGGRG
jgi:hypothetical protein